MFSGDIPSSSGSHNGQSSYYRPAGDSKSQIHQHDMAGPSSSASPATPHYTEMQPMRAENGSEEHGEEDLEGLEDEGMEEGEEERRGEEREEGGGKMKKSEGYDIKRMIKQFWPMQKARVEHMSVKYLREASRNQVLPLARVKKIMKIDENVQKQMIAADAPLLLSVASEMFIEELTLRSWEVTEEVKRKTLQKIDVATATARHDHMDFLVDIIPRVGVLPKYKEQGKGGGGGGGQAQMVQIVRDGAGMEGAKFVLKGNNLIAESIPSTSQAEFSARLESGEEAQVIQIGKPIPLSSQTISQLGLPPLPAGPSSAHPPTVSLPLSTTPHQGSQPTIRIQHNMISRDTPPHRIMKNMGKGVKIIHNQGGQNGQ